MIQLYTSTSTDSYYELVTCGVTTHTMFNMSSHRSCCKTVIMQIW